MTFIKFEWQTSPNNIYVFHEIFATVFCFVAIIFVIKNVCICFAYFFTIQQVHLPNIKSFTVDNRNSCSEGFF